MVRTVFDLERLASRVSVIAFFVIIASEARAQVIINEIVASNRRAVVDEDGDTPDFVELYNAGTSEVLLGGYGLSDDESQPNQWALPEISLPSGAFLLVWCSGKDQVSPVAQNGGVEEHLQPALHTNFKLASDGELILLADDAGNVLDQIDFPMQSPDRSFGRLPDGDGGFHYMVFPTPGMPNDRNTSSTPIPDRLIQFEPESGKYAVPIEVGLAANVPWDGFEIRYTLRGDAPTAESPLYEGPIPLNRDTVIRAIGVLDGRLATDVIPKTYFGWNRSLRQLALPMMSISLNRTDFRAVHLALPGVAAADAEREAYMEIFDTEGRPVVSSALGLRPHGGAGRQGDIDTKKAYRAYFRGRYGDTKLRYPIIPDTKVEAFDKLVLRSNYNDAFRTGEAAYIRDQVVRDLHEDMGSIVAHGTWYSLLVNTEYRGIYNVVERIDAEFLGSYFPDQEEGWDVIKNHSFRDPNRPHRVQDGDDVAWNELKQFLQESDLSDDALYERSLELIDVENFTGYMILQIWSQNHDWPNNNWYAVRPRRPDGKWSFLVWDAEVTMGLFRQAEDDSLARVLTFDVPISLIFKSLLRNQRYRRFFVDELQRHLEGALAPENVLAHVDRLKRAVGPDIAEEAALSVVGNVSGWQRQIRLIQTFANERNDIVRDFVASSDALGGSHQFRRGDVDGNGRHNVTDAVQILRFIFGLDARGVCEDAVDADDTGTLSLTDAVFLLGYVLRPESPVPPDPLLSCGADPTGDGLECTGPTGCD